MSTTQDSLQEHANRLVAARGQRPILLQDLDNTETAELVRLLPYFASTGMTGAELQALRDTIQATVQARLYRDLIGAVNGLNSSTTRLTKVGWVVSALLAVAGILVPLALQLLHR